jgi:hypothetical protein
LHRIPLLECFDFVLLRRYPTNHLERCIHSSAYSGGICNPIVNAEPVAMCAHCRPVPTAVGLSFATFVPSPT